MKFPSKILLLVTFCLPDLQSLSGPELNETCQLLDNFLDNLNFPLLSTIRIGQGTYRDIEIVPASIKLILCRNSRANVAALYQQLKEMSARENLTTGMTMTWPVSPWSPWHLWETLSTCLILSLTANSAPPPTVSISPSCCLAWLFCSSVSSRFFYISCAQVACLASQASVHQNLAVVNRTQSSPTLWFQVSKQKQFLIFL